MIKHYKLRSREILTQYVQNAPRNNKAQRADMTLCEEQIMQFNKVNSLDDFLIIEILVNRYRDAVYLYDDASWFSGKKYLNDAYQLIGSFTGYSIYCNK